MMGGVQRSAAPRSAIVLSCVVAAGCAAVTRAPTPEPVVPVAVTAVDTPPMVAPPATVTAPIATAPAPEVAAPKQPPVVIAAPPAPPAREVRPTVVAAAPVAAPVAAPTAAPVAAPVAASPPVAPLDFTSLGTRLRETKTIGMLTKLAVKNQADDLLEKLRAYHQQQGTATLAELRQAYDTLLVKVLSFLEDGDPPLARDIVQSRAAIWDILADPRRFIESNLMAGATT